MTVDGATPIPILFTCEAAVTAAKTALSTTLTGQSGGSIASISFGYGGYCPPGARCYAQLRGDIGTVLFKFSGGSSWIALVSADQTGAVRVTEVDPAPTMPGT